MAWIDILHLFTRQRPAPRFEGAAVAETGRTLGSTKKQTRDSPGLNVCTELTDSYRLSQETAARKIQARF